MDTNPVVGQMKRAVDLFRQMTCDAAADPIHRAQTRMIRQRRAVASETRFFAPGDQHGGRRVLMRVVTVCTGDLTGALTPAFAVSQSGYLIGDEQVVRHGVLQKTGARMALRARPPALGNRELARVQDAQIPGVGAERG